MPSKTTRGLEVDVESFYLEPQSQPEAERFVFAYKVRFANHSEQTYQLISRHWIISDSNGEVKEVKGQGVIGQQPVLQPGGVYEYVSGSHLKTPMGTMHGTYQMRSESGESFDAEIPVFRLAVPGILQ